MPDEPSPPSLPIPVGSKDILGLLEAFKQTKPSLARIASEIGTPEAIDEPDVDVTLHPSRAVPIAGELWSISGEIHNRSEVPIWIVDNTTRVSLAPEMYGISKRTGSVSAFFPTIASRASSEIVRIDPGAKYAVVWKLDPIAEKGGTGVEPGTIKRILNAISDYAFFSPGTFRVLATVHVWQVLPEVDEEGLVTNTGSSFPITVSQGIPMEASPWVLILGAACGAILCFVLQLLMGRIASGQTVAEWAKTVGLGATSAVILSGVVTVLISRLATTDFLLVIRVKDIWGAIATGFAIQWFGFPLLERLIGRVPSP